MKEIHKESSNVFNYTNVYDNQYSRLLMLYDTL